MTYDGTTYSGDDFEEKEYGWSVRDIEGEQDWDSSPVGNLLAGVGRRICLEDTSKRRLSLNRLKIRLKSSSACPLPMAHLNRLLRGERIAN